MEGKTLAWVLDHPGFFTSAKDTKSVPEAIPDAIHRYAAWIARHKHKKLVRRAIWHERDHTKHIQKLLKMAEIQ